MDAFTDAQQRGLIQFGDSSYWDSIGERLVVDVSRLKDAPCKTLVDKFAAFWGLVLNGPVEAPNIRN